MNGCVAMLSHVPLYCMVQYGHGSASVSLLVFHWSAQPPTPSGLRWISLLARWHRSFTPSRVPKVQNKQRNTNSSTPPGLSSIPRNKCFCPAWACASLSWSLATKQSKQARPSLRSLREVLSSSPQAAFTPTVKAEGLLFLPVSHQLSWALPFYLFLKAYLLQMLRVGGADWTPSSCLTLCRLV